MTNAVMWFRRDLRIADNPALAAAVQAGKVVPLFVLDTRFAKAAETPRMAFLLDALRALDKKLRGRLIIRRGDPVDVVPALADEVDANSVHIASDHGPYGSERDHGVQMALDVELVRTGSPYAVSPGSVLKADKNPYSVFTPFYRSWHQQGWDPPFETPRLLLADGVKSEDLPPASEPPEGLRLPRAGEDFALQVWESFLDRNLTAYGRRRNRPDLESTSRLSPHLKFGTIHPRTLLADLERFPGEGAETFRKELAWREFYADVLHHRPETAWSCLNTRFRNLELDSGDDAEEKVRAWVEGRTGYPIVDAGMRQLRAEGWVHNRVRMIVASFLVKDLHIDWTTGAAHFLRGLVDGDLASNNHGWQWVAGCGTDAAPYYRVFNPILQGKKFDPNGDYVRRYVPELAELPADEIHEPWARPGGPPHGYPEPIVDHQVERREALRRYQAI